MKVRFIFAAVVAILGISLLSCVPENEESPPTSEPAEEAPTKPSPQDETKPSDPKEEPPLAKPPVADKDADFIGLTPEEGEKLAKERGLVSRVVSEDGEDFPVTADYRTDRVNFTVEKGKVVKVSRG